jgi:hypothetical protein
MKVSLVAIKLSLPGLTNVKKEKVLGINQPGWVIPRTFSFLTFVKPGNDSFMATSDTFITVFNCLDKSNYRNESVTRCHKTIITWLDKC